MPEINTKRKTRPFFSRTVTKSYARIFFFFFGGGGDFAKLLSSRNANYKRTALVLALKFQLSTGWDQGYHLYLLSVLELGFAMVRLFSSVQHQTPEN